MVHRVCVPLPVVVQYKSISIVKALKCPGYFDMFSSEAVGIYYKTFIIFEHSSSQFETTDLCKSDQYEAI